MGLVLYCFSGPYFSQLVLSFKLTSRTDNTSVMCGNVGPNCLTHQPIYLLVLKKKKKNSKKIFFFWTTNLKLKQKQEKKKEKERKLEVREGPPN